MATQSQETVTWLCKHGTEYVRQIAVAACGCERPQEPITYFACGPGNETCKCTCGLEGVDHVCEHKWDGWEEFTDPDGGGGGTAVCSRCGMTAMSHSMWVGP